MTVRCVKRQAEGAGNYYVEELGTYYLDGTDGVRRWLGQGAEALGLTGPVDDEQFLRLCEGNHPDTGESLGRKHRERDVRLYDLTFSAPKSVSVLMAVAGPDVAREVLDAHDAAVTAVQRWVEDRATTRYRWQREICHVDVDGIVAMAVQEHTSRALDPQLHTHLVIPNRVLAADGRWLALAAEIIMQDQPKLSALYHATLQAELTARLGLRWAAEGEIAHELADVPLDVNREFSSRTAAYEKRLDTKIQRFRRSQEREPTGKERWRLQREAALESRGAKVSNDAETLAQQWMGRLVSLGVVPDRLVAEALHRAEPTTLDAETTENVMSDAVEALSARQSTWTSTDIIREVARAFPTTIAADATTTIEMIEAIAQRIEAERLIDITPAPSQGIPCRRDGRPITENPRTDGSPPKRSWTRRSNWSSGPTVAWRAVGNPPPSCVDVSPPPMMTPVTTEGPSSSEPTNSTQPLRLPAPSGSSPSWGRPGPARPRHSLQRSSSSAKTAGSYSVSRRRQRPPRSSRPRPGSVPTRSTSCCANTTGKAPRSGNTTYPPRRPCWWTRPEWSPPTNSAPCSHSRTRKPGGWFSWVTRASSPPSGVAACSTCCAIG